MLSVSKRKKKERKKKNVNRKNYRKRKEKEKENRRLTRKVEAAEFGSSPAISLVFWRFSTNYKLLLIFLISLRRRLTRLKLIVIVDPILVLSAIGITTGNRRRPPNNLGVKRVKGGLIG